MNQRIKGKSLTQSRDTFNKFDLINTVLVSGLGAEDKALLIELIMRADDKGECFPSVERLCQVRGITYEKNFKGVDVYLPGLVAKAKRGRRNVYYLNTGAIEALSRREVTLKHTPALEGVSVEEVSLNTPALEGVLKSSGSNTPALEGVYTPAVADNTPAVEGVYTPAVEGANSTSNNSLDSTRDNSSPAAPVSLKDDGPSPLPQDVPSSLASFDDDSLVDSPSNDTPAVEGVLNSEGISSSTGQVSVETQEPLGASPRALENEHTDETHDKAPAFNASVRKPHSVSEHLHGLDRFWTNRLYQYVNQEHMTFAAARARVDRERDDEW